MTHVPNRTPRRPGAGFAPLVVLLGLLAPLGAGLSTLLSGCAGAPPVDLTGDTEDVRSVLAEARELSADPTTTALIAVAEDSLAAASEQAEAKAAVEARWTLTTASATARTALAAAKAHQVEVDAERCLRSAADARRAWQDALATLDQTERLAGRQARAVTREEPEEETDLQIDEPAPHPAITPSDAAEILAIAGRRLKTAQTLGVPASDLHRVWRRHEMNLDRSETPPGIVHRMEVAAARAVQELEFRILAETSRRRCLAALDRADVYSRNRDEALWAMVELERGMKESARTELEAERARLQTRQEELFKALQQFEGQFASIRQEARGTILSLSNKLLFDFDSFNLKEPARYDLVRVATILQQFPEMHIYIEGHTDNVGTDEYNQTLSEKRAQSVLEFLAEQKVPLERLDWFGYGETQPIAANETEEGRSLNRRVDLVIAEK